MPDRKASLEAKQAGRFTGFYCRGRGSGAKSGCLLLDGGPEGWLVFATATIGRKQLEFCSREEARVSKVLTEFLPHWQPKNGETYQRPIDRKHQADFYLPGPNVVLEHHPINLKWCLQQTTRSSLKLVLDQLHPDYQKLLISCFKAEKLDDYTRKRRFYMDNSPDKTIQQARLVVTTNPEDVYNLVVKPYSGHQVKETKFREVWFSVV